VWKPASDPPPKPPDRSSIERFRQIYLRNFDPVVGYFARRCPDPQVVADLTAETFGAAAAGFAAFDPRRQSDQAWLLDIAERAFRQFGDPAAAGTSPGRPRHGRRPLDPDEIEELARRIEAERRTLSPSARG